MKAAGSLRGSSLASLVGLAATACLGPTGADAFASEACLVADPSGTPLNVRAAPNGTVTRSVRNGSSLRILATRDDGGRSWALVASSAGEELGWVYRGFILCGASRVVVSPPAGVSECVVADPTGTTLNVRATPNGAVVQTLANGERVRIVGGASQNGKAWALVAGRSQAQLGWVIRTFLDCSAAAPAARPAIVARPPAPARPEGAPGRIVVRPSPSQENVVATKPASADLVAPPPAASLPVGRRVALVVGNGRYRHAPPLTNPANDAADVAAALAALGFEVVEGRDLDYQGLRSAVRDFSGKLDGAAVALFFYAGHGLQVGAKNYLVPVDAKLEAASALELDTLDVETVTRAMEGEQRVNLVMLDACRDNPFTNALQRALGTRSAAVGRGLAPIRTAGGTLVAFATAPDTVALDGDGARNSPFTTALLKHIRQPGLEVEAMLKRVRGDVIEATRGKQTPWSHSSLTRDVFLSPDR